MLIIVYGNPIDGLSFVGTFEDHEKAKEYAQLHFRTIDWWIAELQPYSG